MKRSLPYLALIPIIAVTLTAQDTRVPALPAVP